MIETVYLAIEGMHCVNCPIKVEKALSRITGVIEIDVNYASQKGCVTFDRDQVPLSTLIDRIAKLGFSAKEIQHPSAVTEKP